MRDKLKTDAYIELHAGELVDIAIVLPHWIRRILLPQGSVEVTLTADQAGNLRLKYIAKEKPVEKVGQSG